jgi:hypothetical protein
MHLPHPMLLTIQQVFTIYSLRSAPFAAYQFSSRVCSICTGQPPYPNMFGLLICVILFLIWWHAVPEWLRHYATIRKVAGSIPDELNFHNIPKPSGYTRPWGLLSL